MTVINQEQWEKILREYTEVKFSMYLDTTVFGVATCNEHILLYDEYQLNVELVKTLKSYTLSFESELYDIPEDAENLILYDDFADSENKFSSYLISQHKNDFVDSISLFSTNERLAHELARKNLNELEELVIVIMTWESEIDRYCSMNVIAKDLIDFSMSNKVEEVGILSKKIILSKNKL